MAPSDPTLAPPPQLLQRLARRRLSVPAAYTAGGVGEHPSVAKGPGLEFAEHRAYQPGDDLRRVDPHVEARSGELYVREFEVLERLAVTVVVDLSASMAFGEPEKAAFARRLAGALAYVGLAGADRVRVAAFTGRGLAWGPRAENARAAGRLFDWLARQAPGGASHEDSGRWRRGLAWLLSTQTADGSWGDTPELPGNLSTTAIVWANWKRCCLTQSALSDPLLSM